MENQEKNQDIPTQENVAEADTKQHNQSETRKKGKPFGVVGVELVLVLLVLGMFGVGVLIYLNSDNSENKESESQTTPMITPTNAPLVISTPVPTPVPTGFSLDESGALSADSSDAGVNTSITEFNALESDLDSLGTVEDDLELPEIDLSTDL